MRTFPFCIGSVLVVLLAHAGGQAAKVAEGRRVMIAAHPAAAEAGLEMIRAGGNVVDAAVAVAWSLGVVEPHGSGIGGEGMMLIHEAASRRTTVIDFKAIAPHAASYGELDYRAVGTWRRTTRAASVPGTVAGLEMARERFGRLSREQVMRPAILQAEEGFRADSSLVRNLFIYRDILLEDSHARGVYYPGDSVPLPGAVLRNPDYARTLRQIAAGGAGVFYHGSLSAAIVRDAKANGGWMDAGDLAAYRPLVLEPLAGEYRGYTVLTTPPPCGGMHLLEALGILRTFDLKVSRDRSRYDLHLLAEVFKLMSRDEATFNGDPAKVHVPSEQVASDDFAFGRLRAIALDRAVHPAQVKPGAGHEQSTTQLSVMDSAGNAVSLTITLSSLFGTGRTVEGTGFMMNNEMQNFSPDSTHPNALRPHARVVTSLVPTILFRDGETVCVVGTPGGDLILSTVVQVIVNLVDYGMPPGEALSAPRLFSAHTQRAVEMEPGFAEEAQAMLRSLGHDLKVYETLLPYFGAVQAVVRDPASRRLTGASDPRRSGEPRGY